MRFRFASLLVLVLASLGSSALAHELGQSYVFLRVYDDRTEATVEITAADLDRALNLGIWDDEKLTPAEADRHLAAIRAYVEQQVRLRVA